jgi:hypothetical protein
MKAVGSLKWTCLLFSLLAFANAVHAQETVGEVLAAGAKQLPKAELVPLLSGASMSGESFTVKGNSIHFEYSADGTVSGYSQTPTGQRSNSTGTWKVDDSGKFCRDMTRQNGQRWGDCRFFFKNGDAYFAAETDDRSAKVERRAIRKK